MLGWFHAVRNRWAHLWAFVDWAWAVVAELDKKYQGQPNLVDAHSKKIYLKGKFHLYRGPLKMARFSRWVGLYRHDPLGVDETPAERRANWGEPT